MSAFICGPDHLTALAVFAAGKDRYGYRVDPRYLDNVLGTKRLETYNDAELASAYADILYAENTRSVLHRYPKDTFESAPGPIEKPQHIVVSPAAFRMNKYRLPPVSILKMCDCLEYQSCETDDYRRTPAYHLLNAIRRAAINALPGYEGAPWEYVAGEARAA